MLNSQTFFGQMCYLPGYAFYHSYEHCSALGIFKAFEKKTVLMCLVKTFTAKLPKESIYWVYSSLGLSRTFLETVDPKADELRARGPH